MMSLRDYLTGKGVWVDGLCWPSFSQSAGSFSEINYDLDSDPISLYVQEQYGRFGNNVHQILNSLVVARRLSIKNIFCNFYLDEARTATILIDDMVLKFGIQRTPEPPQISATMFYLQGFEKFIHAFSCDDVKSDAEKIFRAIFSNHRIDVSDTNKKLVAFYFRSGDIFQTNINPIYTQPPLSYYVKALDHIGETMSDYEICIVYEDDRNPCIRKFRDLLVERKIVHRNQSSSFHEDAGLIARADCIVSSYSSFCDVLALMNENLSRWYAFRSIGAYEGIELSISREFSRILQNDGVEIYLVNDDKNLYTALGDWKMSAEQVDQLFNYPGSNLSLKLMRRAA